MTRNEPAGGIFGQIVRFLLVGGANTLITYAIFIGLGLIIPPWIAYTIAFAVGLIWVAFGSSRIVFKARARIAQLILFILWYLLVFGVGQLIIRLINPRDFPELLITSLLVLLFTTPLTFIGGRYVFLRRSSPPQTAESSEP